MLQNLQQKFKEINITQAIIFSLLGATALYFYQQYSQEK